jgi:PAS domain S-box-containing protein
MGTMTACPDESIAWIHPILESIADGVFTIDLDWRITSFNRAAEKITGTSRNNAIGQKCFDVFRASICQTTCALKRTIATGNEIIDLRVDALNADGNILPISISTAILRSADGRVIGGVETFRDLSPIEAIRSQLTQKFKIADIISKSPAMLKLLTTLPAIAETSSSVLIEGPSGSGKELLARAVHSLSPRSTKPFVALNCSALPDTLLESELFGYKKGAFTGADRDRLGRIARAEKGTLFLDEIGDISPAMQAKLLRFLQDKEYEPLGGEKPLIANVRIIAATNQDLTARAKIGLIREDLYYRLNVIKLKLPTLNKRREDIPLLVSHFIRRFNTLMKKHIQSVSSDVMNLFMRHDFPGNIRELENALEHAAVLCAGSIITLDHLPEEFTAQCSETAAAIPDGIYADSPLHAAEARTIREVLNRHSGHRRETAEELGISLVTLWRKMKTLNIKV